MKSSFFGIGAKEDIYLSPGIICGTIPDNGYFVVQTNSTETSAITLKPNITIPGDVVVGPGGDIDTAVNLAKNVVIEGQTRASDDYIDFPPVYQPTGLPSGNLVKDGNNKDYYIYGSSQLSSTVLSNLKSTETLRIGNPAAVNKGAISISVTGSELNLSGKLIVTPGYSLTLYLNQSLVTKPGFAFTYGDTPLTTDAQKIEAAKAISIKGTVNSDGTPACGSINFQPNGDFYGTIYAPDASPLYIAPTGSIYGAIVGAGTITLKPGVSYMFIPDSLTLMISKLCIWASKGRLVGKIMILDLRF